MLLHLCLLAGRLFLAAVFLTSGVAKLRDRVGTRQALVDFGMPGALASPGALLLPVVELGVAVALIPPPSAGWGGLLAAGLLLTFEAAIAVNLVRGRRPNCHCFGQLHSAPAGWPTLVRTGLLAVLASFVAWVGWEDRGPSPIEWADDLSAGESATLAGGLTILVLLGLGGWVMFGLLRQNGRLLLRVDALETALARAGIPAMPVRTGMGDDAQVASVGTAAPEFSLADLSGEMRTLGSLRAAGRPVLLVFVDPGCGPCAALIPKVAQWQRRHQDDLTTVLVDRRGEGVEHRAKRIEQGLGVVLVQRDREVAAAYGVGGTPAAVLVATNGIIASAIATGAAAIDVLVAGTLARLAHPHATTANGRGGAPAPVPRQSVSAPAPPFSLPDLDGRTVRLADLEGHDTVLVFWNPACGYCQAMLDALRVAVSGKGVVASGVVLISSGGADANRRLGLPCPILLDDAFATGRAFGARGTPSAVVVDAQGRIGSRLVVGESGVLQAVRGGRMQIHPAQAH